MPHLISQRDSHPVCDGENGIKKKTPSGSISALMRRQGRGVVGRGQGTQDYHTAFSKCKLWAIWTNGRLSTAHWLLGVSSPLFPQGPSSAGNNCTHTPHIPSGQSSSQITSKRENVSVISWPATHRWRESRFLKEQKREILQMAESWTRHQPFHRPSGFLYYHIHT